MSTIGFLSPSPCLLTCSCFLLLVSLPLAPAYASGGALLRTGLTPSSPPHTRLPTVDGTNYPLLESQPTLPDNTYLHRSSFPDGFVFGSMTAAAKHEGAAAGKTDSIWDAYARINATVRDDTFPGCAGDQYNQYTTDVEALASVGMDAFRFSLAWTRILPDGSRTPNAEAISHYNDLIDRLIDRGIEPHITLWDQDHPQALDDAYGGPLSPLFIDDFVAYANVCFAAFGDRVKFWVTLEEPNDYVALAYASTSCPPGRCTPGNISGRYGNCTVGNSSSEPYLVAHNMLLAHAAVAKLYRTVYKATQGGSIGIALWFKWYEPLNTSDAGDVEAARRAQDFYFGWFMDPLASGEYPQTMRSILGTRLPHFTDEQKEDLVRAWDFVGLDLITARYVTNKPADEGTFDVGYNEDMDIIITPYRGGEVIGKGSLQYSVPWCVERIIEYMKDNYGNPPMYILKTGWGIEFSPFLEEALNDTSRVEYFYSYYSTLSESIRNGGNVLGVFAWSLVDGFEFFLGLHTRYGLYYVDDNMTRYARLSAFWFQQLLAGNSETPTGAATAGSSTGKAGGVTDLALKAQESTEDISLQSSRSRQ